MVLQPFVNIKCLVQLKTYLSLQVKGNVVPRQKEILFNYEEKSNNIYRKIGKTLDYYVYEISQA